MSRLSSLACFMLSIVLSYSSTAHAQDSALASSFVFEHLEQVALPRAILRDEQGEARWHKISYEPSITPKTFLQYQSNSIFERPEIPQLAFADTPPSPPRTETQAKLIDLPRIEPAGITGSLVLTNGQLSSAALDTFFDLAHGTKSRVVVLRDGTSMSAAEETARLLAHWEQKQSQSLQVLRLPADKKEEVGSHLEALGKATAVWIVGSDRDRLRKLLVESEIGAACRAVLDRGGVVGASEVAATLLTTARLADDGETILIDGLGLLPEAILEVSSGEQDSPARLPSAISHGDGVIGYEIDSQAALVLIGRQIRVVGEGEVRIWLPEAKDRAAEPIVLSSTRGLADLTALRRALRDRVGPQFPPATPKPSRVDQGTLILIGGGGMPAGIVERFIKLAGGEKSSIVILPTANPDPLAERNQMAEVFKQAGAGKVTILRGRTLETVDSDEYIQAMAEATGIWFGGGRQWRFVDAYLGTKLQEEMNGVLRRGGVIMGSSAGASIQAEYLARGNPLGNIEIMSEGYERGLGFLPGAAVDQHFSQRMRQKDMASLVSRYPQLLGIGIDESTALIVQGEEGEVLGRGGIHFYSSSKSDSDKEADAQSVQSGGRYDLVNRKVLAAGGEEKAKPEEGTSAPSKEE